MLELDHIIFGNGFGMRSPYFDNRFYWLSGRLYTWVGGLGAQLQSHQWTHPKAGERRTLAGREFVIFSSSRRWCRVECAWALVGLPKDINAANAEIRELRKALNEI
jgi:hypothetical protein